MSPKTPKKSPIDTSDAVVLMGLACLTAGGWSALGMGALTLPGAVLLWYALPPRPPFVSRQDR